MKKVAGTRSRSSTPRNWGVSDHGPSSKDRATSRRRAEPELRTVAPWMSQPVARPRPRDAGVRPRAGAAATGATAAEADGRGCTKAKEGAWPVSVVSPMIGLS